MQAQDQRQVPVTRAQVWAARGKVVVARRFGQPVPAWIERLAAVRLPHERTGLRSTTRP
ncbi:hypothetical protein [Actinotalea sp. C106]|uniref:hypothetical protein n=1 Tax=Actinotalea sp. C106 TaxID=2908644 RepID=UPI0020298CF4|nr:hypothetical protein [Actinotalea sp. C106]